MLWHALINSAVARLQPYRFVMSQRISKPHIHIGSGASTRFHFVHQPNWWFNADTNIGHAFGIFMPAIGTLQPSASGAG